MRTVQNLENLEQCEDKGLCRGQVTAGFLPMKDDRIQSNASEACCELFISNSLTSYH